MYVNRIIAIIDGTRTRMVAPVGSQRTAPWDTGLLNNSEMDMIFVCLRGARKVYVIGYVYVSKKRGRYL